MLIRGGEDFSPEESLSLLDLDGPKFRESRLLYCQTKQNEKAAPTPLHEVGTWRMPMDPSYASKVRQVDAAIEAFAATFGLKDGKEQQDAMDMLEALVPPLLTQLARQLGVNASLTEQDRRSKVTGKAMFFSDEGRFQC